MVQKIVAVLLWRQWVLTVGCERYHRHVCSLEEKGTICHSSVLLWRGVDLCHCHCWTTYIQGPHSLARGQLKMRCSNCGTPCGTG